jgi:hypothetical protein
MSKVTVFGAESGGLTYLHGFTRATFDPATAAAKRLDEENSILNPRTDEIAIPRGTFDPDLLSAKCTPQSHEKTPQPAETCPILGEAKA